MVHKPCASQGRSPFDPFEDTESQSAIKKLVAEAVVAAHSIRSRILKAWPPKSRPLRPCVAAHSIRSRILKDLRLLGLVVVSLRRSPFDPFEDTESCDLHVRRQPGCGVAAHSIRSRILKVWVDGTEQTSGITVAAHSIRSRILKGIEATVQVELQEQVAAHSIRSRILKDALPLRP